MPGLPDLISGLREAEDQYRQENAEAFFGMEPDICGMVQIAPFTPKMFIDLDGSGNAFFAKNGTAITASDIAVFLWRCHPLYVFGTEEAKTYRSLFNASLFVLPYSQSVDDISAYIRRSWQGMPLWPGKVKKEPGVGQWPARLVHLFAKEYGWSEEYTLNLPFRRLWQYANRILEEQDPKYKEQCARALTLRSEWLIAENARLQAELAANKGRN